MSDIIWRCYFFSNIIAKTPAPATRYRGFESTLPIPEMAPVPADKPLCVADNAEPASCEAGVNKLPTTGTELRPLSKGAAKDTAVTPTKPFVKIPEEPVFTACVSTVRVALEPTNLEKRNDILY